MGVSLRVLSLGWLGVGSCRWFVGRKILREYCCGYFMANGKTRGFGLSISVAISCRLAQTCCQSTGEIILESIDYR
jgi:hypothetical protein